MLLEEFDVEKYERTIRREGREEGIEKAHNEAIDKLINALKELAVSDEKIRKQLMKQYGLSDKEAEGKLKNYSKC